MKSIEFGENEGHTDESKSLEVLLLEKNKSCQSDNTMLKLAKQDLEGRQLIIHLFPVPLAVHHIVLLRQQAIDRSICAFFIFFIRRCRFVHSCL